MIKQGRVLSKRKKILYAYNVTYFLASQFILVKKFKQEIEAEQIVSRIHCDDYYH